MLWCAGLLRTPKPAFFLPHGVDGVCVWWWRVGGCSLDRTNGRVRMNQVPLFFRETSCRILQLVPAPSATAETNSRSSLPPPSTPRCTYRAAALGLAEPTQQRGAAALGARRAPSGYNERQSFTAAFTLIPEVVLPHRAHDARPCGKPTTNSRVNAACLS